MDMKMKWNSKYKERLNQSKVVEPNARLMNMAHYLKGGIALDLACGLGGNSFYLGQLGYQVEAIDISDIAIDCIQKQAKRNQLQIHAQVSDLTAFNQLDFSECSFDVVVMTYYLDRSLFPSVKKLVKKKGYFFMETFFQSSLTENQGVSNQYKLRPQELLTEFAEWNVLFFEENEREGRQTIFCKKS